MPLFRVLRGRYVEGKTTDGKQRIYVQGDIIDSKSDLMRFNSPGAIKFEKIESGRLPENTPTLDSSTTAVIKKENDGLEAMSIAELRKMAEEEEIDIKAAKTKDQLVAAIRTAFNE